MLGENRLPIPPHTAEGSLPECVCEHEARRQRRNALRRQGMTLIEIMIVVVIMALVATGVGVAVLPALGRAKIKNTESAIQAVRGAVTMYLAQTSGNECPKMEQLVEGKFIDKSTSTKDGWEHDFLIECDGTDVTVTSAGPNGQFGDDDDIPKAQAQK